MPRPARSVRPWSTTNATLQLVKNHFAGPANQCYKVIIAELDMSPPGDSVAAGYVFAIQARLTETDVLYMFFVACARVSETQVFS